MDFYTFLLLSRTSRNTQRSVDVGVIFGLCWPAEKERVGLHWHLLEKSINSWPYFYGFWKSWYWKTGKSHKNSSNIDCFQEWLRIKL